jgi:hypothetical protein
MQFLLPRNHYSYTTKIALLPFVAERIAASSENHNEKIRTMFGQKVHFSNFKAGGI